MEGRHSGLPKSKCRPRGTAFPSGNLGSRSRLVKCVAKLPAVARLQHSHRNPQRSAGENKIGLPLNCAASDSTHRVIVGMSTTTSRAAADLRKRKSVRRHRLVRCRFGHFRIRQTRARTQARQNCRRHMSWTDERVELLRKLWQDGLSASQIASELGNGITRNAVIGKVHRLGMSGRVKPPSAATARPRAPKTGAASWHDADAAFHPRQYRTRGRDEADGVTASAGRGGRCRSALRAGDDHRFTRAYVPLAPRRSDDAGVPLLRCANRRYRALLCGSRAHGVSTGAGSASRPGPCANSPDRGV